MRLTIFSILIVFTAISTTFSQDRDSTAALSEPGAIRAEVQVEPRQIPANRTAKLILKVTWQGQPERYEVVEVEQPVLNNLEIVGNASSNWVGEVDGVKRVVKTYEFTIEPQTLGMAYIDAIIVEYRDQKYDEKHSLVTNRLPLEVIDPSVEKDYTPWFVTGGVILVLGIVSVGGISFIKRKREKEEDRRRREQALLPIELRYLSELKQSVDLKATSLVEAFAQLSRLLRRYLSERFRISAKEMSTEEIVGELSKLAVEEKTLESVEEVLKSCDVAKFSGGDVERGTLERSYTLVEDMLERNKQTGRTDGD